MERIAQLDSEVAQLKEELRAELPVPTELARADAVKPAHGEGGGAGDADDSADGKPAAADEDEDDGEDR